MWHHQSSPRPCPHSLQATVVTHTSPFAGVPACKIIFLTAKTAGVGDLGDMPLVDTIRLWAEGVEAADRKDFRVAFAKFEEIMEPSSKIYFNIGCISMTLDRLGDAVRAFDRTIAKDEHLAVAFFQRGAAFLRNQLYEEALRDFQEAHKRLRGNTTIDYEQLGLAYKLHLCVVLHNVALAHASLGQWVKAQETAQKAKEAELQPHQTCVDRALDAVKRQEVWEVCAVPCGVMFRPQKQQVEQLGKKDYLGKATVVASLYMNEDLPEITSQQPQGGKKRNLKIPAPPVKEPPPRPTASEEGQRQKMVSNPPARAPPVPLFPSQDPRSEVSLQMPITVELNFTQTVTMRARPGMSYADFLALISEKVKQPEERLQLSYRMEGSGDSVPMTGDVQMQRLWERARNGKLTLCCQQLRPGETAADEHVLRRVVALCDYDAKEPGDLGFREGDIIRVISEVNANWLEGRCRGNVGIFPTSFVRRLRSGEPRDVTTRDEELQLSVV
ncbi:neutrophil cytosol factor 2-like isoform X2 [Lampetra planeri]